jgi:hypothetical protein
MKFTEEKLEQAFIEYWRMKIIRIMQAIRLQEQPMKY